MTSEQEALRLREELDEEKEKARRLSLVASPLRRELETLDQQLRQSYAKICRTELLLACLESRIELIPVGTSKRQLDQVKRIQELMEALPTEKAQEVLRLLQNAGVGLPGGVGSAGGGERETKREREHESETESETGTELETIV